METLESYINGKWTAGSGEGVPMHDAVTGEVVALSNTQGFDLPQVLQYGRSKGAALRKMTFQERGEMLKKLAFHLLKNKKPFYELSYRTGATQIDSWIDIEGGVGNLFANASLRKLFPNQSYHVEGDPIDLSRGGRFMAHHILVPKRGVAIHINAYNFPIWGMLEKCAVNWMAGVPAIVKPATETSYLTEAVVRVIVASGILPEGALQLISGSARGILDHVESEDVVTFTGSADTGRMLKANPRIVQESVPFNMEADSLNSSILGEDAAPGTPEFDIFIKEVRKEMTVKCGQKCTAIRRIFVPQAFIQDVQDALAKQLAKVTVGDPRLKEVRMGSLVSKEQVTEVKERVEEIAQSAKVVYGRLDGVKILGESAQNGAFISPMLLREDDPLNNTAVHETEAFGPVSTLMPYKSLDEAIQLVKMGKGSLVSSIITHDDAIAKEYVLEAATHHGRILVLNRENAKESTGHGSPLPTLIHGGPGRAGGGEEMGGMRGVKHYLQRCAVQGTPTSLTEITGIYQAQSAYKEIDHHPFSYYWEDIEPGMSLKTHKRTITDGDIVNFANLSWDHFYAHTDITSLDGSIFEKRTAHGYFILSAAAGLFVYPNKGPVAANYGLEDCRFLRPIYHNDTVYVRLTCKQKIDRDQRGKELPSGIAKWYVEVFDASDELVAIATILTMVQKKLKNLVEMTPQRIQKCIKELTAQDRVEQLDKFYRIATGEVTDIELITQQDKVEAIQESLYNFNPLADEHAIAICKNGSSGDLKYDNLESAKAKLLESRERYITHFKESPEDKTQNPVFGELDRFEWQLLERKFLNYHFEGV